MLSGRKFVNKWDEYDVDQELARLDTEETAEEAVAIAAHVQQAMVGR